MTEDARFALLRDLAALVRRHGPQAFSELATYLKDPVAVGQLVSILETTGAAGRRAGVPGRRKGGGRNAEGENVRQSLKLLATTDPEKARVLSVLLEAIAAKLVFPTVKELRNFASDNGLRPVNASSRDKAVTPFLRDLATRPIEEVRHVLEKIRPVATGGDRTLEGWAGVILGKGDHGRGS